MCGDDLRCQHTSISSFGSNAFNAAATAAKMASSWLDAVL
jgi:hypothetical protein